MAPLVGTALCRVYECRLVLIEWEYATLVGANLDEGPSCRSGV